jgi:threonyl-tRNA synthetase
MHSDLWKKSGHWDKFQDNMVLSELEQQIYCMKPMNCPGHVQIFRHMNLSYRHLPLRLGEFGSCIRRESSGSLMGLMRTRAFVQDDGHIFCRRDQILEESKAFCASIFEIYNTLGFYDITVYLSTRPMLRHGSDILWDEAEAELKKSLEDMDIPYRVQPGEGAFYGPKLEFHLKDTLGRAWQCGTLQLDFVLPERLSALYTASDGTRQHAVMLHRAILGSFERFLAILIEHTSGKLPLWLAPIQMAIIVLDGFSKKDLSDSQDRESAYKEIQGYAQEVVDLLKSEGIRIESHESEGALNQKILKLSQDKIPYIGVIGYKEVQSRQISLRIFGEKTSKTLDLQEVCATLKKRCAVPE